MYASLTIPTLTTPGFPTNSSRGNPGSPSMKIHNSRSFASGVVVRCVAVQAPAEIKFRKQPPTLYDVLKVEKNATPMEIKASYRSLAKKFHPDVVSEESDGEIFVEIHRAYATLSDPESRTKYDLSIGMMNRFPTAASFGNRSGYKPMRWETDQCW